MAKDTMPKGADFKQLDWINIWKPNERNGETERVIEVIVWDRPRAITVHRKFVRTRVYDAKQQKYVLKPQMHYIRCNTDDLGFCSACMSGEYVNNILAVPVLEISRYEKDGEKKVFISKKILGLGGKSAVKINLESSDGLGTDYSTWLGAKLKLTRVAGQNSQSTGDMVRILNPVGGKNPTGQAMLDKALELNPHLDLTPVETVDFDKIAMRCMSNDNLTKFIDQLNGANSSNSNSNSDSGNRESVSSNNEILEDDEIPF